VASEAIFTSGELLVPFENCSCYDVSYARMIYFLA
jgi:hypothetical protein